MRLIAAGALVAATAAAAPVASWSFDGAAPKDSLQGHRVESPGVSGKAFRGDGFTTRVVRPAEAAPKLTGAFTVEAWIAPQEYSWAWTGLVDQEQVLKPWTANAPTQRDKAVPEEATGAVAGYSLGINQLGQIGLYAAVGGKWQGCLSQKPVPLLKWSHVAGVFNPATGFKVYVNGQLVGQDGTGGSFTPASNTDLWIGTSHRKQYPAGTERGPSKLFYSAMVFDGLLDEARIHDRALSAEEIRRGFESIKLAEAQPLQFRRIPTGPEGPGRFGAFYTRLKYCEEWDRLWRVAEHPDVVVQFDQSSTKLIFWRGTGYIPYWAAENGVCVADQGVETGGKWGCAEAMSDKQCRYSHVRILESTPARAVVHWRTASPGITYEAANSDPDTGWGEWTDEYFYIYPDGVSVRYQRAHGFGRSPELQQTQTLNQPGTRPEDNLMTEAITVLNMKGEEGSFVWDRPYGREGKPLAGSGNIQVTNLKARSRHYVIGEIGSRWVPFRFGAPPWTTWPCWNHWPVAQLPSDGCVAAAPDRPSSSCCGTLVGIKHPQADGTIIARNLYGMTDKPSPWLVALARSWNKPAELKVQGEGIQSLGYDPNQRAYILELKMPAKTPENIELDFSASAESPVLNPAFVIKNWGECDVRLSVDGKEIPKAFRIGHVATLEGTDLIVWFQHEATGSTKIVLEKQAP